MSRSSGSGKEQEDGGEGEAAEREPLLVLGCHDALHVARVFVDDTASLGIAAVEAAISTLRCGEPICAVSQPQMDAASAMEDDGAEADSNNSGGGGDGNAPEEATEEEPVTQWEHWRQRVRVELLGRTPGSSTGGCVTSVSSLGESILVSELLGSSSIYKVGVDDSDRIARIAQDISPVFSSAGCQISPAVSIVSVQPYGLMLLRRDFAAEQEREAALLKSAAKEREAGARQQQRGQGNLTDMVVDGANDTTPHMQVMTLCRKPQLVTRFCRGRLGLTTSSDDADRSSVLYVTACGMVGSLALLPKETAAVLHALQTAMQRVEASGRAAAAATSHQHRDMWEWSFSAMLEAGGAAVEEEMLPDVLPSQAVDGDLLSQLMELPQLREAVQLEYEAGEPGVGFQDALSLLSEANRLLA